MTTITTYSAGPRVDWPGKEMPVPWDQYFQITRYPEIGLYIHTGHNRDGTVTTTITEYFTGLDGPLYRKDYDPTRVTVGGLAEAHEAVCARVEKGELP